MRSAFRLLACLAALASAPISAQSYTVVVEEWVESVPASRFVSPQQERAETQAIAAFGPFRVLDESRVALVGITDARAPAQFAALLAAFPEIAVIEFVEAPGTHDDRANMALGRMIRAAGIASVVAEGGSVRSGAVELFLAGSRYAIDPGAQFAVHGWLDDRGRGAEDYPVDSPEHRRYLDYYAEMGMEAGQAARFYAMTNSVPYEEALWLTGADMREWIGMADAAMESPAAAPPTLASARLDFARVLH